MTYKKGQLPQKRAALKINRKTGDDVCLFNRLYWNILDDKTGQFAENKPINMRMALLEKKYKTGLEALRKHATHVIEHPEQ